MISISQGILRSPPLLFQVTVSLFGLFLVGFFSFNPPTVLETFYWRKPVIGTIFGSICILGILAVFFPRGCSHILEFKKKEKSATAYKTKNFSIMRGHHPICERFSSHVFQINNRTFCTSCTGLLFGGLFALVGTLYFFFGNMYIETSLLVILMGLMFVSISIFQPLLEIRRSLFRLSLNICFVIGNFLILIGTDKLAQNFFFDLFLISLSVYWLFTRISLSHWNHRRICHTCKDETCKLKYSVFHT